MQEVKKEIYLKHFHEIFNWFEKNVHASPECYNYSVNELDEPHLKLIELSDETNKVFLEFLLRQPMKKLSSQENLLKIIRKLAI